jgi:tol-pal system protein YbgF
VDTVSGQVQALNDSLDEIKARMNRLEKAVGDIQSQTQSISGALQNLPQSGAQPSTAAPQPASVPPPNQQSALVVPAPPVAAAAPSAPPVGDLYKAAYSDYIAAKYSIATSEFGDVIKNYPDNSLSGNAFYYLGEIDYRAGKYGQAAKDYDKVLEQFPDSNKVPAAHLHKGQALLAMNQTEAGVRELRALIQRFPTSPEATQARTKLNAMGVPIHPRA